MAAAEDHSVMPKAASNGIEIEYEQLGPAEGPPLLLVMGLGAQMIQWDEAFISLFVDRGFQVTRFDNRDVGLSTKLDAAGPANVMDVMAKAQAGETPDVAYTIDDMADDTAGLLDALRIESAHVVGASMGGMIAQTLAIRHPRRVRSLVSIMSSSVRQRMMPYLRQTASNTSSSPASAPVWLRAAWRPGSEAPTLTTMIGLPPARAFSATAINASGRRMPSTMQAITRVLSSSTRKLT